jgi:hypothetical protein
MVADLNTSWRYRQEITVGTFSGTVIWEDEESVIFKRHKIEAE